ncbi:MAG: hypothetical protein KGN79_08240, partial [Acidobacteriota bacterium]|nr:hypothetical protein [Acidobacteriota bacterium]
MSIPIAAMQRQRIMPNCRATLCVLALGAVTLSCTSVLAAPQKPTSTSHTANHRTSTKKKVVKSTEAAKPAAPAQPEMPKWPVNDSAEPAKVTWDSHGLEIRAANSSLIQILHDYAVATGSKIEGLSKDERIFGTYGPGSANEVLTRLLNGSGYNVLMFGDLGQGTPR